MGGFLQLGGDTVVLSICLLWYEWPAFRDNLLPGSANLSFLSSRFGIHNRRA